MEEEEVGPDEKPLSQGPVIAKKALSPSLVEEQKKLNQQVQDQRRGVGRIRILSQLDRWTKVKKDLGLTSHEDVAKLLLDSFDKVQELDGNFIQVTSDIFATFEEFKVKTRMNAGDILKFFLSLEVLPGDQVIAVDNDVSKTFETLKQNLALNSTQLMNYLFSLHEGSGMKMDMQSQLDAQSMSQAVRQAVREEVGSLIREGVLPTRQPQVTTTLTPDGLVLAAGQDPATLMRNTHIPVVVLPRQALNPQEQLILQTVAAKMNSPATALNPRLINSAVSSKQDVAVPVLEKSAASYSQAAVTHPGGLQVSNQDHASVSEHIGKRRSRKSQPQRVVVEAEDAVIDLDAEEDENQADENDLQLVESMNGDHLKTQVFNTLDGTSSTSATSISRDSPQYQYVLNNSLSGDSVIGVVENGTIDVSSLQTSNQSTNTEDDDDSVICYNSPEDINSSETSFFCPYCTYRTPIIARLKRHMTIHTGKVFKCSRCEKSYTEEYKLREHFKIKHEKSVHFVCEQCNRDFTSKGGLKYHMKTMHRKEFEHWCDACCKGFKDPHMYETHIEIKHNRSGFACSNCSNVFKSAANLSMHKKACSRLMEKKNAQTEKKETNFFNRFPCEVCPQRFSTFHELRDHSNTVHSDINPHKCACGMEFKLRASYNGHRHNCKIAIALENEVKNNRKTDSDGLKNIRVLNVESLKGKLENQKSSQSSKEDVHSSPSAVIGDLQTEGASASQNSLASIQITNLESGEQFVISDKERNGSVEPESKSPAKDGKLVTEHGKASSELVMHFCEFCDYKTPKLSHIKRHKMVHTGKKYKCDKCPKSFNEKGKLKIHMNSKHKGHAKYKCDVCFRTFSSKGGIVYHQQTKHNNTHKYRCETCEKGFNNLQHYMGHKNTHSGIRPHVCDICNMGFSYPSVLIAHRKICKGKKEEAEMEEMKFHPCTVCGEKFIMLGNLEEHIKKEHSMGADKDLTAVLCECGVVFSNDVLKEHKASCTGATVSQMFVKASADGDVAMDAGDEISEFKQISPEKFKLITGQPVFPT